jgi:uncharacterized protein YbjT (DUF2867 family)
MRLVLFGATGMLGSGALIECLAHPDVEAVLSVGRRPCGVAHGKLEEVVHQDLFDYRTVRSRLEGHDACLYCVGVSSVGVSETDYRRVTYEMTLRAAEALLEANRGLSFCYISGAGADATEQSRLMWAREKGRIENRLRVTPFKAVWLFRPGFVQPVKGVRSRTRLYNAVYGGLKPLYPVLERVASSRVTTTEKLGLAMIRAARDGAPEPVLENRDINELAGAELGRDPQHDALPLRERRYAM